jgi:hypothetical protein
MFWGEPRESERQEEKSGGVRAVWSFWSRPFQARKHPLWYAPLHHLLAWGLSVQVAGKHYPDTMLVTDTPGRTLLVDQLGIPFRHVSTELDRLSDIDPAWFSLGKLVAYSIQDRPFVHIDADVFLWKQLPRYLTDATVIAQCPEFHVHGPDSPLRQMQRAFNDHKAELPMELAWAWAREDSHFREENCGIVGGSNLEFLRHYAQTAISLVMDPEYAAAWSSVGDPYPFNWCIEQFLLAACVDFHRLHSGSPYHGVSVNYVFASVDEACDLNRAARAGFTHLWGGAKSHPAVGKRLEERLRGDDPAYFRRCQQAYEGHLSPSTLPLSRR